MYSSIWIAAFLKSRSLPTAATENNPSEIAVQQAKRILILLIFTQYHQVLRSSGKSFWPLCKLEKQVAIGQLLHLNKSTHFNFGTYFANRLDPFTMKSAYPLQTTIHDGTTKWIFNPISDQDPVSREKVSPSLDPQRKSIGKPFASLVQDTHWQHPSFHYDPMRDDKVPK